jgi:hypothetical protein
MQNLKLTASSTADKLPLEKFHRLLDLVFWVKFLKFDSISCFVFLWDVNRVSLDPVFFRGACGARNWRGRGAVPSLAAPPAHDQRSLSSVVFTQFSPFMEMVSKQFSHLWNWL